MAHFSRLWWVPVLFCSSLAIVIPAVAQQDSFSLDDEDNFSLDEEDGFDIEDEGEQAEATAATITPSIGLTLGNISADNFNFSKYNGLSDKGAFADIDFVAGDQNSSVNWALRISDIGLDTGEVEFGFRSASNLRLKFGYIETPLQDNNTGFTPFSGGSNLILPSNWTPALDSTGLALNDFSNELRQESLRKRLSLLVGQQLTSSLSIEGELSLDEKHGSHLQGMAIYSNAANPQVVMLPAPIDQQTNTLRLNLGWQWQDFSSDLRYVFTDFNNNLDTVTWQNPYASGLGANIDYPNGIGGYSSAPDYEQSAIALTTSWRVMDGVRLVIDMNESETDQQGGLSSYTANPLLTVVTGVPARLNGGLEQRRLNAALLTRPVKRLTLNLRYKYEERDNTSSRQAWQYVRGDGANQQSADHAVYNRPLQRETEEYSVEAGYRFPNGVRAKLRYGFEEKFRNYAAVTDTESDEVRLRLSLPAFGDYRHRFEANRTSLTGSTYEWSRSFFQTLSTGLINQIPDDQRWTNHPLLRQYHLADQDDTGLAWHASWSPDSQWQVLFNANRRQVKFNRSEQGLKTVDEVGADLQVHYAQSEHSTLWAWINYEDSDRLQGGRAFRGGIEKPANQISAPLSEGSDPTRNYLVNQGVTTYSMGLGTSWQISEQIQLSSDYSYLLVDEAYTLTTFGANDLIGDDLPITEIRMHALNTRLSWDYDDQWQIQLGHQYYYYTDDNWQYQNVDVSTINKVLGSGQQNPNQVVNVVTIGTMYRF